MTLPNKITLARIFMIPVFVWLTLDYIRDYQKEQEQEWERVLACAVFAIAAISDAVDGYIARRYHQKSELGVFLDPLADKLLLVSSFVILTWLQVIPLWLMILVLTRDVVILAGYLVIYFVSTPIEVNPTPVGKLNTFLEMLTIGLALVTLARPDMTMASVNLATWYFTAATITISGVHYVYSGLLWYQRQGTAAETKKREEEGH